MGMQSPSQHNQRVVTAPLGTGEFYQRFRALLSPRRLGQKLRASRKRKQRRDTKLSPFQLIVGTVYHSLQDQGPAQQHIAEATGVTISGAQVSKRRQQMGSEIFEWILQQICGGRADPQRHPAAFYRGLRLVGIDGSLFSLFNTPAVLKQLSKACTRRMQAAFAKLGVVALVELGTHRPMAAVISQDKESEMALATRLVNQLPAGSLLLADRLYGVGKFLVAFLRLFAPGQSDFLVRVKTGKFHSRCLQRLADGSALLELLGTDAVAGGKVQILVREIHGVVIGRNGKRTVLRLWTSLLDAQAYPGLELLELYAQRWEQELSYKELKINLGATGLLTSYTPTTGRQEIAALLIAQAVIADLRLEVGHTGAVPVLRVSFVKVLSHVRSLWNVLAWSGDCLRPAQRTRLIHGMFDSLLAQLTPPRRARSCPRTIRQPVSSWPRKLKNGGCSHGAFRYELIPA